MLSYRIRNLPRLMIKTKNHLTRWFSCIMGEYAYWLAIRRPKMNTFNTVWEKKNKASLGR